MKWNLFWNMYKNGLNIYYLLHIVYDKDSILIKYSYVSPTWNLKTGFANAMFKYPFQLSQTTLWVVKIWHFVNILWCIKLSTFYPWIFLYLTQNLFRGIFFTFVDIQNQGSRKQGGNNIRFPPVHLQPFSAVPSSPSSWGFSCEIAWWKTRQVRHPSLR